MGLFIWFQILGQVDSKFIAAKIKSKSNKDDEEFLVLFDQHAVHERIRLENHLAGKFCFNMIEPDYLCKL